MTGFSVRVKLLQSFFSGLLLLVMVLAVYFFSIYEGHTEGEVRAIAFSALITGNIILILTNLSKTRTAVAGAGREKYSPADYPALCIYLCCS